MSSLTETQAFAARLREALQCAGLRASPTAVANEFNLRYWGRSITSHTARNWLLGKTMPTQDKLRVLAQWLQVGPDVLRFGQAVEKQLVREDGPDRDLSMADREMLERYLSLPINERKVAREVVAALALAASVRRQPNGAPTSA